MFLQRDQSITLILHWNVLPALDIMKVSCRLLVSSLMAIALISAAAIAIILLAANVTMANAQQQQQLTSQDSAIERGTTSRSTRDSFRVQVPQGWVIHDVKNTGSALV